MRIIVAVTLMLLVFCGTVTAEDKGYQVIEGSVEEISASTLKINDLYYPISPFAQVTDAKGKSLTLAEVAGVGHIDKARVYVLDGKVEKITVIIILQ